MLVLCPALIFHQGNPVRVATEGAYGPPPAKGSWMLCDAIPLWLQQPVPSLLLGCALLRAPPSAVHCRGFMGEQFLKTLYYFNVILVLH